MSTQILQEYKDVLNQEIVQRNSKDLKVKLKIFEEKLENELTIEDIENLNPEVRGYPTYLPGTFDENGIPNDPAMRDAYDNIVLGLSRINLIEGGVRAGKDVIGLALVGDLFMLHPANTFGVLGISLEHAIQTVFNSDGFGLFYVIPHGRLTRENVDGAQRVVYRFKNFWGIEKKIVIYGNANKNDWEKYHGFSVGAWYINEGINQVVRGIEEADQRMIASPMPVMVITQNPEGPMNRFYQDFENQRLPKDEDIITIKELQEFSKNVVIPVGKRKDESGKEQVLEVVGYKAFEDYQYKKMQYEIRNQLRAYLREKQKPNYNTLTEEEQVQWNNIESRIRFMYEKHLRGVLVKDIFDGISENHPLADKSWKKVVHYKPVRKNPNGITNNIDFSYYHITMEDNKSLTEEQKAMARHGYKKGSSIYLQKIMGVRKAVDSAILDAFGEDNLFYEDVNKFKKLDTRRVIVIDFGAGKASGIADYELDFSTGTVWQTRERHITPESAKAEGRTITDELIYDKFLELLKEGKKNASVIIDNANLHLKNYFRDRGIIPIQADKRYEIRKGKEIQRSFDNVEVDKIGLGLLNLGFDLKKLFVHGTNCPVTISQLSSYEYDSENEITGKVNVIKVNDEFCDTYRYLVSTMLKGTSFWYKGGELIDTRPVLYDDEEQGQEKRSANQIASSIQQRIAKRGQERFFNGGNRQSNNERARQLLNGQKPSGRFFGR